MWFPGPEIEKNNHLIKSFCGGPGGGFLEKSPPGRRRQGIFITGTPLHHLQLLYVPMADRCLSRVTGSFSTAMWEDPGGFSIMSGHRNEC
jgi:hypothetical protein